MGRILTLALLLWFAVLPPLFAGEISSIHVEKDTVKKQESIIIKGDYGSYQAIGLKSPARFIIDLNGATIKQGLPNPMELKGEIVDSIEMNQSGDRLRIALRSANPGELFHSIIQEIDGNLVVKCWMPGLAKTYQAEKASTIQNTGDSPVHYDVSNMSDIFGWPEEKKNTSEAKKQKITRFSGKRISVTFFKEDLHNVLGIFNTPGFIDEEMNFIIDDDVKGKVTMALRDLPWDLVLNTILEEYNLVKEEISDKFYKIKLKPTKTASDKGELVVNKYSDNSLQPVREIRQDKANIQKARETVLEGISLEESGNLKDAILKFEESLSLWKNLDVYKKTAYLHYSMGNFAKSFYYSGQALRMNPKDGAALLYAALSADRMGNFEKARYLFEAATEAQPKLRETFYNYGLFLEKHNDPEKALEIYNRFSENFTPTLEVSIATARLYEKQENYNMACKKYNEIQLSGFSLDENVRNMINEKIQTSCSRGE